MSGNSQGKKNGPACGNPAGMGEPIDMHAIKGMWVSRMLGPAMWLWTLTSPMTSTLDLTVFQLWEVEWLGFNSSPPSATYMHQWTVSALVQVMAWQGTGVKPLPKPMLAHCKLDFWEQISVKIEPEFYHFHSRKCIWNCLLPNGCHFVQGEMS